MKVLFIPRDSEGMDHRSTLWCTLERHVEVDTLPLPEPSYLLARHSGTAALADCLEVARRASAGNYDYVVGHANSLLWLSIFRLAGVEIPFAIVPNFNHVQDYHAYSLALASQFRGPNDLLFTGSRASQQAFERFGWTCFPHHAPGVPVDTFRLRASDPAVMRQRLGIDPSTPVLLYTGRLHPDKGIGQLLLSHHLVKQSRPAHLVVSYHLWHDEYEARCRQLGAQVGDVSFIKDPSTPDLAALYHMADLFVLFGVSEFETFGRSPVEAMACGAVPVVPRYDGFCDNIPAGGGVLVKTHGDLANRRCEVPEFAASVIHVLSDPDRLHAMKHTSMSCANQFDNSACVERFVRTLAGSSATPTARSSGDRGPTRRWSNQILPAQVQAMTGQLESLELQQLLSDFLASKTPRLTGWPDHFMDFRRMWFASFFPES